MPFHSSTDVGRERELNEDAHGELILEDGGLLLVVADGMGGHAAGEVASGLAVDTLLEAAREGAQRDPREVLARALIAASDRIMAEVANRPEAAGMGTTIVTAWVRRDRAWIAHVGDSRLYHVRRGLVVWRTIDHTRVQSLVDAGLLTADEARVHPDANVITRALGHLHSDGGPVAPEVHHEPLVLEPGDALVLCSDGLHDSVEDVEVAELASSGWPPELIARRLVALANDRGGHDNITATVLVFSSSS
jgi:PPM family protein phosphatase